MFITDNKYIKYEGILREKTQKLRGRAFFFISDSYNLDNSKTDLYLCLYHCYEYETTNNDNLFINTDSIYTNNMILAWAKHVNICSIYTP